MRNPSVPRPEEPLLQICLPFRKLKGPSLPPVLYWRLIIIFLPARAERLSKPSGPSLQPRALLCLAGGQGNRLKPNPPRPGRAAGAGTARCIVSRRLQDILDTSLGDPLELQEGE